MILLVKKIKLYLLILKMLNNIKEEYIKCLEDPFYFIKKYCVFKDKRTGKLLNLNITRKQYERFIELTNRKNFKPSTTFAL